MSGNVFETFTCSKHGKYNGKKIPNFWSKNGDVDGNGESLIDPICPKCDRDRVEKDKSRYMLDRAKARRTFVEKKIGKSGIYKRFEGKDFINFYVDCHEKAYALRVAEKYASTLKDRVSNGDSLIFCGGPGTGKSHLASAIVKSAINGFMTAAYLTVTDVVIIARSTYNQRAERTLMDEMKDINRLDLLVIDEVGQNIGNEDRWLLFHIIDTRYRMCKPVILVSNFNIPELIDYLGERIVDRVCEGHGVAVPFGWKSYRKGDQK